MKSIAIIIKSLLLCISMSSSLYALNRHVHPQSGNATPNSKWAGSCEVEIINQSYLDVQVFGIFDDGSALQPFNIYSFSSPHYISLYYNGYCHAGLDLDIDTFSGYHVFGYYVPRGTTVRIVPGLMNQVKAIIRN